MSDSKEMHGKKHKDMKDGMKNDKHDGRHKDKKDGHRDDGHKH